MVFVLIEGIMAKMVTDHEAMDYIFSELNTEDHPVHIYDSKGNEMEW